MCRASWAVLLVAVSGACGNSFGDQSVGCRDGIRAGNVEEFFTAQDAPLNGGDYQRAHHLGGDRTLWTFQDALVAAGGGQDHFAHNAGVLQHGDCWTSLTPTDGQPWLLGDRTETHRRWFWPLGSEVSPDGRLLGLFMVELAERGSDYLEHVEPVGSVLVLLDVTTLGVVEVVTAPVGGPELYGWSIASDDDWSYLYSWCLRQFGWSPMGHDTTCTADVRVARVPLGELTAVPEFWDGRAWQPDPDTAVSVVDPARGDVLPIQVRYDDGEFLAVSKPGDWYGDTVFVDRSDSPVGPWAEVEQIPVSPMCDPNDCNTYFASFAPDGDLLISNNRWADTGAVDPAVYRPSLLSPG